MVRDVEKAEPKGQDRVEPKFVQGSGGSVADAQTGEILSEGFTAILFPKRINGFERWFAMSQSALTVLKGFKRVDDFRVLMALLEQLDFDNFIMASQSDIAKDLDMAQPQVSRAIKRLVEVGALIDGPKVGTHRTYRLSPDFGWKGSARSHREALDEKQKLRERMVKAGIKGLVQGDEPVNLFEPVPGQMELFGTESQP